MRRVRTSLILLLAVIGALLVSWLQLARDSARIPAGSSYSYQPDGAAALYEWSESVASARRLGAIPWPTAEAPKTVVIVQPELPIEESERDAFSDVLRDGGTLILVGDSPALQFYARDLGVEFEPTQIRTAATGPDGRVSLRSRYRLPRVGTPLLTAPNGDPIALQRSVGGGTVIVVATPEPATNAALRDDDVARFMYRTLLASGTPLTFDEAHHTYAPTEAAGPATVDGLLFGTAPGRAIVYAAVLVFLFLLLAGRRLGPPVAERSPTETRRTMYEHVQMLAGLYRRARRLEPIKAAFQRHYQRRAARTVLPSTRAALLDDALRQVHDARSEADLIAAVADADRALSAR